MSRAEVQPDGFRDGNSDGRAPFKDAGEQNVAQNASFSLTLSSPSGPLVLHTTQYGRTVSSSPCSLRQMTLKCAAATITCRDNNDTRDDSGKALPMFPSLRASVDLSISSLESELSASKDIAKEAMRLSRQTRSEDECSSTDSKSGESRINPRLSMTLPTKVGNNNRCGTSPRLNKFVRRLHDMISKEKDYGLVEWRRGLFVLKSTGYFAKNILPKYFNTRNFKTFRRQLNYYGFVHIRSFSNAEQSTCALWVNGELAKSAIAAGVDPDDVSSVLLLRRVEIADQATTNEMRRIRKELAIRTIEKDLGISAKALQLQTLTSIGACSKGPSTLGGMVIEPIREVDCVSEWGDKLKVDSVMYIANNSSTPTIGVAVDPMVVSIDDGTDKEAEDEEDPPMKAPPSNASAANLLLLLSKA